MLYSWDLYRKWKGSPWKTGPNTKHQFFAKPLLSMRNQKSFVLVWLSLKEILSGSVSSQGGGGGPIGFELSTVDICFDSLHRAALSHDERREPEELVIKTAVSAKQSRPRLQTGGNLS